MVTEARNPVGDPRRAEVPPMLSVRQLRKVYQVQGGEVDTSLLLFLAPHLPWQFTTPLIMDHPGQFKALGHQAEETFTAQLVRPEILRILIV